MNDIGLMHYFLGLKVWQEPGHIFLGQGKYAVEEIQDGGLQAYVDTYDHQLEKASCF